MTSWGPFWGLCWRDIDVLQSYRELRWRIVKMVRNTDGMAISEKNRRFSVVIYGQGADLEIFQGGAQNIFSYLT